jgi:hypothetical protein
VEDENIIVTGASRVTSVLRNDRSQRGYLDRRLWAMASYNIRQSGNRKIAIQLDEFQDIGAC